MKRIPRTRKCPRCGEPVKEKAGLFRCECGGTVNDEIDRYAEMSRPFYIKSKMEREKDGDKIAPMFGDE